MASNGSTATHGVPDTEANQTIAPALASAHTTASTIPLQPTPAQSTAVAEATGTDWQQVEDVTQMVIQQDAPEQTQIQNITHTAVNQLARQQPRKPPRVARRLHIALPTRKISSTHASLCVALRSCNSGRDELALALALMFEVVGDGDEVKLLDSCFSADDARVNKCAKRVEM